MTGFQPQFEGDFPSLGYYAIDWMEENLAMPDRPEYEPFVPTDEQANFLINLLRVDEPTGKSFDYRRAVYSRPKGSGKSPFMSAIAILFALADIVPDGYDANGEPVGKPLHLVRTPLIQLAAVSEDQAANMYTPVLEMIRMGPVMENYPGVDPMNQFIGLPGGSGTGRIEPVTASSTSREGNRPGLAILDQVESWTPSNGGTKLAAAIRRNVAKVGGISIETPNAYIPGERSVAEDTAAYYHTLLERDIPPRQEGLLYDHREAPADTDLLDEDSLRAGLRYAYGDSTWVDLERLIAESRDPTVTEEAFRRYYLNQVTAASDSWISRPEWEACRDESLALEPNDKIVLGFDGSRGRARGRSADATALVALRLRDKLLVPIHVWEQPDGAKDWSPDVQDVHDTVRDTFNTYNVVGMYCDPSGWQEHVARWEALYGRRLKIKASSKAPMSIWPRGKGTQISGAIRSFRDALVQGEIKHNGSSVLGRHMLNARRRAKSRQGYLLYKEHPESAQKIDAAYASIMAYQAMLDAVGAGQDRAVKRRRGMRIYR